MELFDQPQNNQCVTIIVFRALTRERQVPSVFLKDEIATIEDNAVDLLELAQSPHTVKDALGRGSGPFLIRDHTHVRVHDVGLLHDFLSLLILRRIAAIVASAISSNSLPKKSLGQLRMFPYGSRSS